MSVRQNCRIWDTYGKMIARTVTLWPARDWKIDMDTGNAA